MNQKDITTTPQPHPWVTDRTPDNLRDPQLLQDLSEIGMTCLLGWHALSPTPHSYGDKSAWYGKALDWAVELERLHLHHLQDELLNKLPEDQRTYLNLADHDISCAYRTLFLNISSSDGRDPKTVILQRLAYAHNIIRHLVKGDGDLHCGRLPSQGDPEFLVYNPDAEIWIAGRGIEDIEDDEYQD